MQFENISKYVCFFFFALIFLLYTKRCICSWVFFYFVVMFYNVALKLYSFCFIAGSSLLDICYIYTHIYVHMVNCLRVSNSTFFLFI